MDISRLKCPDGDGTFGGCCKEKAVLCLNAEQLSGSLCMQQPVSLKDRCCQGKIRADSKRLFPPHLAVPELGGRSMSWQQELSPTNL